MINKWLYEIEDEKDNKRPYGDDNDDDKAAELRLTLND